MSGKWGVLARPRPAVELLLCCARTRLGPAQAARVEALITAVDWDDLLATADANGVVPLLYRHLSAVQPQAVPPAVLDWLRDEFQASAQSNLFLTGELIALLKTFRAHAIPAIPYKGPALAAAVYGNLALRPFGDLDLLVRKRDLRRARELLVARGYAPRFRLRPADEAAFLRSEYHDEFTRADGVHLEIHWEIVPRYFAFRLELGPLWDRLGTTSLGGVTVPNLAPEDQLLVLCVHGAKHRWERLIWICDLAELLAAEAGLDWERALAQAARLGGERMLLLGLFLAADLLEAPLPAHVAHRVRADPAVRALAGPVRERLFSRDGSGGLLDLPLFYLRVRERLRDRARYCLTSLVPTVGDSALLPLPPPLGFLRYLLRPIRLAGKYGFGLWSQPGDWKNHH